MKVPRISLSSRVALFYIFIKKLNDINVFACLKQECSALNLKKEEKGTFLKRLEYRSAFCSETERSVFHEISF